MLRVCHYCEGCARYRVEIAVGAILNAYDASVIVNHIDSPVGGVKRASVRRRARRIYRVERIAPDSVHCVTDAVQAAHWPSVAQVGEQCQPWRRVQRYLRLVFLRLYVDVQVNATLRGDVRAFALLPDTEYWISHLITREDVKAATLREGRNFHLRNGYDPIKSADLSA